MVGAGFAGSLITATYYYISRENDLSCIYSLQQRYLLVQQFNVLNVDFFHLLL